MLTFYMTLSGDEVGHQLADEPKELWYTLQALKEKRSATELAQDLVEACDSLEAGELASFLRALADGVDPAMVAA